MSLPRRGEVWWADMGLAGKVRPVVVVSAEVSDDDYALLAMVPHTSSEHFSQYAISLKVAGLKEGAFNVQALGPLPLSKFIRRISALNPEQIKMLESAIKKWLSLS